MEILGAKYFPITGSFSNAIRNAVMRGKQIGSIKSLVKKLGFKISPSTVKNIADYFRATRQGGNLANQFKGSKPISDAVGAKHSGSTSLVRAGYILEFYDPELEEDRTWGGFVDVDGNTTIEELRQQIYNDFVGIFIANYKVGKVSEDELIEIYNSITFKTIEGI
jgi:hypothetical protein